MCRVVIFLALVGLVVGNPSLNDAHALIGSPSSVCRLRIIRGPCRALFRRYGFNRATGVCQRFIYGGCAGNTNNFVRREQCQRACGGP
ncbi:isoinhibitor K-like [Pollicipes pollicipes]|uniref:isoinhibitor K-like n=1 Tax=Pollicipes pollicipes TaxID=41117 RepID=UPI0018857FBD|nr:isoinhibitor K-like [Pollicipes pollicipes]